MKGLCSSTPMQALKLPGEDTPQPQGRSPQGDWPFPNLAPVARNCECSDDVPSDRIRG